MDGCLLLSPLYCHRKCRLWHAVKQSFALTDSGLCSAVLAADQDVDASIPQSRVVT